MFAEQFGPAVVPLPLVLLLVCVLWGAVKAAAWALGGLAVATLESPCALGCLSPALPRWFVAHRVASGTQALLHVGTGGVERLSGLRDRYWAPVFDVYMILRWSGDLV